MRELTGGCKPCGQESMLELSNRLPQGVWSHGPRPRSDGDRRRRQEFVDGGGGVKDPPGLNERGLSAVEVRP
jgi:hypothetical protein